MSLVRWNSRNDLANTAREFDSILNSFWNSEDSYLSGFNPSVDIEENENEFLFFAELPGLSKENVKISLDDNTISITGEKESRKKEDKHNYHRIETSYGKFQRSFKLPQNVKRDEIKAAFSDGILNISVPKAEESKPKEITIV